MDNMKFELKPYMNIDTECEKVELEILDEFDEIDQLIVEKDAEISAMSIKIDGLTNQADAFDCSIAVASGILAGLIDSFFVGELDLIECHDVGNQKIEEKVKKLGNSEDLKKAIQKLEEQTKKYFPSDANLNDFGGGRQHHLRDFAHHPTLLGLVCSILTQFTGMCYGTNVAGSFITVPVKDKSRIAETIPKKIIYATLYWYLHLVSDMAGSQLYAGKGTGLPGPLLSSAKALSSLPFFSKLDENGNKEISVLVSKLFNGTFFAEKDESGKIIKETVKPIDLRTEIGIIEKQTLPIIINECIVRSLYFVRQFGAELKDNNIVEFKDLERLNWKKIIPFGNRTVERMITIASGTFCALDITDAVIRSGGLNEKTVLRLNFVGIGRFTVALGTDMAIGLKKSKATREQLLLKNQVLCLMEAKMYRGEVLVWEASEKADAAFDMLEELKRIYSYELARNFRYADDKMLSIHNLSASRIKERNPTLAQEILKIL